MDITNTDLTEYLENIEEKRKDDINTLLTMFEDEINLKPKLWGSIVGFGNLHYKYKTGRQGNMPIIGFANRKQALTLYLSYTISDNPLLDKLGKHKVSVSCLYINKLADVDLSVLRELIRTSIQETLSLDYERIE